MFRRDAAPQIPSASAASFFCRFTNDFTWTGGTGLTSWPGLPISRPQWCALAHASIATTQHSREDRKDATFSRTGFLRNATEPSARAPCT